MHAGESQVARLVAEDDWEMLDLGEELGESWEDTDLKSWILVNLHVTTSIPVLVMQSSVFDFLSRSKHSPHVLAFRCASRGCFALCDAIVPAPSIKSKLRDMHPISIVDSPARLKNAMLVGSSALIGGAGLMTLPSTLIAAIIGWHLSTATGVGLVDYYLCDSIGDESISPEPWRAFLSGASFGILLGPGVIVPVYSGLMTLAAADHVSKRVQTAACNTAAYLDEQRLHRHSQRIRRKLASVPMQFGQNQRIIEKSASSSDSQAPCETEISDSPAPCDAAISIFHDAAEHDCTEAYST